MLGPYEARADGSIYYRGNRAYPSADDVRKLDIPLNAFRHRVEALRNDAAFEHISRINHRINTVVHQFFNERDAYFTLLPLTTRMISSPGAVYGKEAIDYTTDTCPITLQWFDLDRPAFLSESSQIYLELALAQPGIQHVYSVYNSFRLEQADATHLSEFHHIEYEGRISQADNLKLILSLIGQLVHHLLEREEESLAYFLPKSRLIELDQLTRPASFKQLTFAEALQLLYEDTGDDKYKHFTMKETFGSWEEIRLTWICGGPVTLSQFPLLEVPFYHAVVPDSALSAADNTDIIWPGYREVVGSGQRIRSIQELEAKAKIFNLPREDYMPYLRTRLLPDWSASSGFGIGWERLLQGLLEMPAIWDVCHFPRTHIALEP